MGIKGDLDALLSSNIPPREKLIEIFEWMHSADVIRFLELEEHNSLEFSYCVSALQSKMTCCKKDPGINRGLGWFNEREMRR